MKVKARTLTESDVEFTVEAEEEDIAIEGSFDSGDAAQDKETAAEIRAGLNAGNEWAWCCVKVTAKWRGFTGVDYLGACSYASEKDFRETSGYFEDMKERALEELNKTVQATLQSVGDLIEAE